MRKLGIAIIFIGFSSSAAFAADIDARPYAPVPMIAPGWDWSGFYYGANGGYASSHNCWDRVTTAGVFIGSDGCHNATGAVAGIHAGYRTQSYQWVFGVEAQGDWARLSGSQVSNAFFFNAPGDATNRSRVDALGLFTGHVGYAWSQTLFYVKGGAAVTANHYQEIFAGTVIGAVGDETRIGGTVGAGVEYSFAPSWSFGVVYDHLFMGTKRVDFGPINGFVTPPSDRIKQDIDLVTVRLTYVFGGPSIAKY